MYLGDNSTQPPLFSTFSCGRRSFSKFFDIGDDIFHHSDATRSHAHAHAHALAKENVNVHKHNITFMHTLFCHRFEFKPKRQQTFLKLLLRWSNVDTALTLTSPAIARNDLT